jgi:hypothetical protein
VQSLKKDKYSLDFKTIGPHLDAKFQMQGFFDKLLKRAEKMLHSFTHSGAAQLNRRFIGADLTPDFLAVEIEEAISGATAMAFMVTMLVTRHLGFDAEWKQANEIYINSAKHLGSRRRSRRPN